MAILNWLGRALARAQISTVTPGGTIEVGDLFYCTINGKSISFAATGTTVANVVTGLVAAWNASTTTEFAAITATDSTTHMTLTADTAGVPFTVTVSTTESNGGAADAQTIATATTTTATGPNHWTDTNNWDTAAIPVNSDTVNIDLGIASILYGLDQSAVTVAVLNITNYGFTQNSLGLPRTNSSGYTEDQEQYLKIGAALCIINSNSPRIKINFGSVLTTTEIRQAGQAPDGITPAVLLKGTNTSNSFDVVNGSAGLAYYDGESVNGASLTVGSSGQCTVGSGGDFDNIVSSGVIQYNGTGDNFQTASGAAEIRGTPGFALLDCNGGTTICKFSGTISDVVVGPGTLDASQDNSTRIFTDTILGAGGQIIDPEQTISYANGITLADDVERVAA
jgi:trimeric autotransporter adhesin